MKKIISSEWFFVFIVSIILIFIAFIPYFHQLSQTPKDSVFIGTHNYAQDYSVQISEILQSQNGRWTNIVKFTSEPQIGTLIHWFYFPLGKIGLLLNLDPFSLYNLSRAVFGLLLSLAIYYFIQFTFDTPKNSDTKTTLIKRRVAFILALFSAGFSIINWNFGIKFIGTYLPWWTGGDILRRAVFHPHAMTKNILLLVILVWMGKYLKDNNKKYLIISLPLALFLGILDPVNSVSILLLLGGYGLYQTIKFFLGLNKDKQNSNQEFKKLCTLIFALCTYAIFVLPPLFYLNWVFNNTVWKAAKDWEALQYIGVPFWEYANHIGITFCLGIPGLILLFWKKRSIASYFALALTFGAIFLLTSEIIQKIGMYNLRFFQTPTYVFLAIGTTELIFTIAKKIKLSNLLLVAFALLLLLPSLPAYYLSIKDQFEQFKPYHWNVYPDKKYYQVLLWLKNNTSPDSIILSNSLAGNLIPAVSGNTSYIGHTVSTINFNQKNLLVKKFLNGEMNENEAKNFLMQGRIDYVILSWGEQFRVAQKNYPFLKKIFENETATIYKFQK